MSEEKKYPPTKNQKITGLFRREGPYGEFWTGKGDDGQEYVVNVNGFKKEGEENKPDLILSKRVPVADEGQSSE